MNRRPLLTPLLLLATAAATLRAEPVLLISTNDGLSLEFSAGGLSGIRVDNRPIPLSHRAELFSLRNAGGADFTPVDTEARGTHEGPILFKDLHQPLGLHLDATLTPKGPLLILDGTLSSPDPADHCVDLKISLPLSPTTFTLNTGLSTPGQSAGSSSDRSAAPDSSKRKRPTSPPTDFTDTASLDDNALYPLCPVSNTTPSINAGLTLALPPTHPTRFQLGSDQGGPYLLLRIGLSRFSSNPSHTPFRVILYRHDPTWGFRSSLDRYYSFFPEFFTRHIPKIGLWTSQNTPQLRLPDLYAYHEAGFPTWHTPTHDLSTGINVPETIESLDEGPACHSLAEYERLCDLPADRPHGILSLPYTIVGQRQLLQLDHLPKTYDEAMHLLDTWTPKAPILFDGPPQALCFRTAGELKSIIRNSTLHDPQHRLYIIPRPYRGPTLTFPQNPSPFLYNDDPTRPTVAKFELDYYVPLMLQSPHVDGIYVDSLGRWCGLYNYRADHFRYSTLPLTYAGSPAQPCIWNLQSHAEYLTELASRLHAKGKTLFANGVHPARLLLGFRLDAMGAEGTPDPDTGESFYAPRVAAGIKPYCYLNAPGKSSPKLWNASLYMGYLLNCNTPAGEPSIRKYIPTIIQMNESGWQPVTHATASPSSIGIERWGTTPDSTHPLFFSLYNHAKRATDAEIHIDRRALHLPKSIHIINALTHAPLPPATDDGDHLTLHVPLPAEEAAVLVITPTN